MRILAYERLQSGSSTKAADKSKRTQDVLRAHVNKLDALRAKEA